MTRPRPVLSSASIAGVITALASVLAFLGYDHASAHLSDASASITSVVIGAVALGSHLLAALHAQNKVTPVADPVAHDGTPLVKATDTTPVTAEVVAPAEVAYVPAHAEPEVVDANDDGMDDPDPEPPASPTVVAA